jgi:N4-gp56 family major capsid protein
MPVTQSNLPDLFPAFYDKKLLEYVKAKLVARQFGQKRNIRENTGRTITFTKFAPLPESTTPLTDQPTPATGKTMSTQQISAVVEEYGDYIDLDEFTDVTSYVPLLSEAVELLADQANRTLDAIAMNEITAGTNVIYPNGKIDPDELTSDDIITKDIIGSGKAILEDADIPPFPDGYYVCLIHPNKLNQLFTPAELIQLSLASKSIFETGNILAYNGVKFVSTTRMPVYVNAATTPIDIYKTILLGPNSYGVIDVSGKTLQMTYTNTDKLGRIKTPGWKAYFAAKRLNEDAMVRIESA